MKSSHVPSELSRTHDTGRNIILPYPVLFRDRTNLFLLHGKPTSAAPETATPRKTAAVLADTLRLRRKSLPLPLCGAEFFDEEKSMGRNEIQYPRQCDGENIRKVERCFHLL